MGGILRREGVQEVTETSTQITNAVSNAQYTITIYAMSSPHGQRATVFATTSAFVVLTVEY